MKNHLNNIAGFASLILWSFYALFASYSKDIPTFFLLGCLALIMFVIMFLKWILQKENIIDKLKIRRKQFITICIGVPLSNLLYYTAFKLAPSFMVNILVYLWPMLLVLTLSFIDKRKLHFVEILGILLGFLGGVLLAIDLITVDVINFKYVLGYSLAILFSVITVLYFILLKKIDVVSDDISVVFLYSSIIYFLLHFLYEDTFVFSNNTQYITIIALSICGLATFFWNYAMHNNANVKMLASFSYFIPLVSSCLLWLFLDVNLTSYIALSSFCVIVGAILCNFKHIERHPSKRRIYFLSHMMYPHIHMKKKKDKIESLGSIS